MRETIAEIRIGGPKGSRKLRAVVDTGAINTVIDGELAKRLGIEPVRADEVILANGSVEKLGVGSAEVEIEGITQVVPAYIYKGNLIGLTTLEAIGLRVNPVTQTVEKVPGELLRIKPAMKPLNRIATDKSSVYALLISTTTASTFLWHLGHMMKF